jgi:3-mercaptopyruvate sulfurtransferase SseA
VEQPREIDARQAYEKTSEGRAMLVCAHPDEAACHEWLLDGAMTLSQLASQAGRLPRDQELIFYDNEDGDAIAHERADEYEGRGFEHVRVLTGGVQEWKLSGYPLASETPPENPPGPTAA